MFLNDTGRAIFTTSSFTTLAEWKAHLQANPMTVVYELAEPIETPLSANDLKALKGLKSFQGVTNVFNNANAEMDLLYSVTDNGVIAMENYSNIDELRDTKLSKSGGQITGNITGTQNGFKIDPTGDIYSDKWGSKWLSTALGEKLKNSGFTPERVLISGSNGVVTESGTTSTELYMLHGVTNYVQTQLNEHYNLLLDHNTGINNINSALQNKVSTNSEARLQGIHLSSSNFAYMYTEDDNVNFRYKTASGNTAYSNLRQICKGSVSGTTLNITLG